MAIQVDVSELAGLVVESILYGIFICLSLAALHTLLRRRRQSSLNIPMLTAAIVMMVLATSQIVVDTVNIFGAFISLERQQRILLLSDVTQPIFAAKHAIYFTMMLIGDIIVIYRAFIVWESNFWVIVFPSLCSLGSAISAYQTIWAVRHIASASIKAETGWGLAVFSLSLAANTIATGLIAFKIWQSERHLKFAMGASNASHSRTSLMPVVILVIESGLLNAAYLLAYTIVLRSGSHGLEIMASIATPYIGIIFSGVIICAGLAAQRTQVQSTTPWKPTPMPSSNISRSQAINISTQWSTTRDDGEEAYDLQKMNV